jgi:DNA-binding FrmR family transcriptional regulator
MGIAYIRDKDQLLRQLRKIEGQVRGIQRMVDEERYCADLLSQIAAVKQELNKVSIAILESHTKACVAGAVAGEDGNGTIDGLMKIIFRYLS